MHLRSLSPACFSLVLSACGQVPEDTSTVAQSALATSDWAQFAGDSAHSGVNAVETRLTADNVANLRVQWTYADIGSFGAEAAVFQNSVYLSNSSNDLGF